MILNLKIIGYFTKNRYFYDKIFSTIICENKENIYMIEMHDDKIEIIYVGNEELKLTDEEMVILKIGNYFINEKNYLEIGGKSKC